MENIELTLNKNKSFSSVNEIQNLHIDLESEEKLLPVSGLQGKIDAYEQYLKEKDACNNYRFIFTIHPYCSNILFNHITEAVYNEGSDNTKMFLREKDAANMTTPSKLYYANSKPSSGITNNSPITRDTGYSGSKDRYYLNYNCGIDIFNNHLLRRKDFVCVNQTNETSIFKQNFNTLFDEVRDPWGFTTSGFTSNVNASGTGDKTCANLHLYNKDSIYSFTESVAHNLKEENGWVGFNNNAILNTMPNTIGSYPIINRVLNNIDACTFVDMYPTRKHYSFVPYFNTNRKRVEYNWKYLLTYPFKNVYDNNLVRDNKRKINGILCDLILPDKLNFPGTVDGKMTIKQLLGLDSTNPVNTPLNVTFCSHTKHNLSQGDRMVLHVYNSKSNTKVFTSDNLVVASVGNNGYDEAHYFSLSLGEILSDLTLAYKVNTTGVLGFRYEKISVKKPCRYYLRKFRKIPNFVGTNINTEDGVSDDEILSALQTNDFSSSLNKLGFSKTIYGDDISQIIYDDVKIEGLRDNLGRELSVIYLTLIKTNYGHEEWYENKNYTSSKVEYSHCFGKITSGFDLLPIVSNKEEFNIHKQHNVTKKNGSKLINDIPESSDKIEISITSDGTITLENNVEIYNQFEFYGDIVELNEETLEETVLETIQHRFNTAQREFDKDNISTNPFAQLIVDDITSDDYMSSGFTTSTGNIMCNGYWANISQEGYYYQAHYPIRLKEYSTTVNTGYHTKIDFTYESGDTITTDVNYYLEMNNELYMFRKNDATNTKIIAHIGNVGGNDFTSVQIILPNDMQNIDFNDYLIFKPNILKPSGAYDFGDIEQVEFREKSGRYVWRDILPTEKVPRDSEIFDSIFTNGAIYYYKDVNFYLKRQDPYGDYGLRPVYDETSIDESCVKPFELELDGNEMDVSNGDYFEPGENNMC